MSLKPLFVAGAMALGLASSSALATAAEYGSASAKPSASSAPASQQKVASNPAAHHHRHHMKPRSEASMQCSSEANTKGLHGKARREFRSHCMKEHTAALGSGTAHKPAGKKADKTASKTPPAPAAAKKPASNPS